MAIIQAKSNLIQTSDKGKPLRGEEYNSQLLNTTVFIEAQDFNRIIQNNGVGSLIALAPIRSNMVIKEAMVRIPSRTATGSAGKLIRIGLGIVRIIRRTTDKYSESPMYQLVRKLPERGTVSNFVFDNATTVINFDYSNTPGFLTRKISGKTIREIISDSYINNEYISAADQVPINPTNEEIVSDSWYLALVNYATEGADPVQATVTNPVMVNIKYTFPVLSSTVGHGV